VITEGWIDADVAAEFPELRLHWADLPVEKPMRRTGDGLREQLRLLSDGFRGAQAVTMRSQPIHHAQRAFFRHIGLDPDRDRPPAEAIALERLRAGHFKPGHHLEDAIVIAVMETGVPVWALDAAGAEGPLGIRPAVEGEPVAGVPTPAGRLVVADSAKPVAVLYGDTGFPPTKKTDSVRLFTVQVAGIPMIHVEEALWTIFDAFDTEL
jgi:DNA/RNA-binding domain of Phe-tRNA-synthetase-like protein